MKRSSPQTPSWTVPAGEGSVRLDAFVRRCLPHLSLREVRRAVEEKAFWLHGRPAKKGERLCEGDVLTLRGPLYWLATAPLPGENLDLPILYEDESVLAVDKPAGMATHGFSGRDTNSLANFLAAARPALLSVGKSRWEPGLVHRLDRETSGVVLAAKDQGSFEDLRSQFRRGAVRKRYWALVRGRAKKQGTVPYPLIHDPGDRRKMQAVVENRGRKDRARKWKALTRFRLLGYARGFSLLEVEMETGVTHQIRVHLAAIGLPLAGDPLYGEGRTGAPGLGRHLLHASYLEFRHPGSNRRVSVESPLPVELRKALSHLGIKSP